MDISQLFFETFYLYLPAMVANMAPIIAHKLGILLWLDKGIDFRKTWKGIPIFGPHKTFRGFVVGSIAGMVCAYIQAAIVHVTPYQEVSSAMMLGALMGFGALLGDAIKSFFKRRMNIASGSSWIPFDQIDFVLGATLAASFVIHIPMVIVICSLVIVGCASYIVSVVGVALHIKRSL